MKAFPPAFHNGRAERLRAYCRAVEGVEPVWGRDDCTMWAARWFEAETGCSLRLPEYDSESAAREMIEAEGGLFALWARHLARNGARMVTQTDVGDVVVVQLSFGSVGGIVATGDLAAIRSTRGVNIIRLRADMVLGAWATPG